MNNKNSFVSTKVRVACLCHPKVTEKATPSRNKRLIRFLESFVLLPVITVSMPLGGLVGVMNTNANNIPQVVLAQQQNIGANGLLSFNQDVDTDAEILKLQAEAIDAYFKARNMPMFGTGMKFAEEAKKNDLDWRLLPAISVIETTGGKHACPKTYKRTGDKGYTYNAFGWGSCKISFKSKDHAIEVIAKNLSGNNPNTEHHYDGKNTKEILEKYNPPSIKPHYARDVMNIMDQIGKKEIGLKETKNKSITT